MKSISLVLIQFLFFAPFCSADSADDLKAKKILESSENQTRGDSFQAEVTMIVQNSSSSERTIRFRNWSQGREESVIKIIDPTKDRDIANLRIKFNLWQYLPNVERIVKIPPSMMLQSWMGSDFTNDDLVKSTSLSRDYTHKMAGTETIEGNKATKIICTPKPDAAVAWGKVIVWVRESDSVPLKNEFYSENGELIKVMEGHDIKTFGKHTIPSELHMTTVNKKGAKTIMKYSKVIFDEKIDSKLFTQEYIRKPMKE